MKVFSIISEFRILRPTFHRKSTSKSWIKQILIAFWFIFSLPIDNWPFNLEIVYICRHTASFKIWFKKFQQTRFKSISLVYLRFSLSPIKINAWWVDWMENGEGLDQLVWSDRPRWSGTVLFLKVFMAQSRKGLTHKESIICSRRQFQILPPFPKKQIRHDISGICGQTILMKYRTLGRRFSWDIVP